MRYLIRLVTPPVGTVCDPFVGSGSTGKAAMLEGFDFVGIDRQPLDIAGQRIACAGYEATREARERQAEPQLGLFANAEEELRV
jgi:site-specific DNA-methyltransferase (adenine-specific)